jgi:hypothetical protein
MNTALSRVLCQLGLLALALGGVAAAVPSLAVAHRNMSSKNPKCNHVISHSVTLTHNMVCNLAAEQAAIIIGAPDITVNLHGFTIENVSGQPGTTGVDNFTEGGLNGVTIENGKITGFDDGIGIIHTGSNKISNITVDHNSDEGLFFGNSHRGLLTGVKATNNGGDGIDLHDNHRVTVMDSKAQNNGANGVVDTHSFATIDHVKTNHNGGDGILVDFPRVANGVTYLIENSTDNSNTGNGFEIRDNVLPTYQAKLVRNTAEFNGSWGYLAQHPARGKNNGAESNGVGDCFNVPCHVNP